MDLRQLEILQAIAETGSFTACGRKLHVSQSAISRQILLLEEELGEPLFLRVGRKVRMTPAAESLVQLGKRVFQDVRETVGVITDRTRELRGTLRLSGGMTVCLYVFPPLLKYLRRVHPQLDVRLRVATGEQSPPPFFFPRRSSNICGAFIRSSTSGCGWRRPSSQCTKFAPAVSMQD